MADLVRAQSRSLAFLRGRLHSLPRFFYLSMKFQHWVVFLALLLVSCVPAPASVPLPSSTTSTEESTPSLLPPSTPTAEIVTPPTNGTWQIQYDGNININLDVDTYNLDLFETEADTISDLHARNIFVMCYFDAGSFEEWRPDAADFPAEVIGKKYKWWHQEKWLDIRKIDILAPIVISRLDLAVQKGCDGVDPDNINGFANETGFQITYQDQLKFNIWLAESAHARGLSIGLKNDLEQIHDLLPYFDWQLSEECFQYNECKSLLPFIEAGKPVFDIEYRLPRYAFCKRAKEMGINSIRKNLSLNAYLEICN